MHMDDEGKVMWIVFCCYLACTIPLLVLDFGCGSLEM